MASRRGTFLRTFFLTWELLTKRQKIAFSAFAGLRSTVNVLDSIAIGFVALATSRLSGDGISIGFLDELSIQTLLILAGALFLSKTLLGVLVSRLFFLFVAQIEVFHSKRLINAMLFSDAFSGKKASDMEWLILRSTDFAFGRVLGQTFQLISEATLALLVLVLFMVSNPILGLAVILYFGIVVAVFQLIVNRDIRKAGERFSVNSRDFSEKLGDTLRARNEIIVTNHRSYFRDRLVQPRREVAVSAAQEAYFAAVPRLYIESALLLGAISFVVLLLSASEPVITLTELSILVVGSLRLMSSLLPVQRAISMLKYWEPQAESAHKALAMSLSEAAASPDQGPQVAGKNGSRCQPPKVLISNITYDVEGKNVLQDVSLSISAGEFIGVVGPSGSGKTTLLSLCSGIISPQFGSVEIDETDPASYRDNRVEGISVVTQFPTLISGSIAENLAFGSDGKNYDQSKMLDLLDQVGLGKRIRGLKDGLDTRISHSVPEFSGGEQQRLGIARALLQDSPFLILDEATSALDPESDFEVTEILGSFRGLKTIIMSSHRFSSLRNADRIVLVVEGEIVGFDTFQALLANSELVRKYADLMKFE